MDEEMPLQVYSAIEALGVKWFEPKHGRPNFRGSVILIQWYGDLDKIWKRLGDVHGYSESPAKDSDARDEIRQLLRDHGHIWCENPSCPRLSVNDNNPYFKNELFYPLHEEKLIDKHLQLLKCKWKSKARSGRLFTSQNAQHTPPVQPQSPSSFNDPSELFELSDLSMDCHDLDASNIESSKRHPGLLRDNGTGDMALNGCDRCRKFSAGSDGVVSSCDDCLRANREHERHSAQTVLNFYSFRNRYGSVRCPYPRAECPAMLSDHLAVHEKTYHFSCSRCQQVFSKDLLHHHAMTGHDQWDLLPLDPLEAMKTRLMKEQRAFPAQGYWLTTDCINTLNACALQNLLGVREEVGGTILQINVEGMNSHVIASIRHCYTANHLASRIAHREGVQVELGQIQRLFVMLDYAFDFNVKLGEYHVIDFKDEKTFMAFIHRLEGAYQEEDEAPRELFFRCCLFDDNHTM